MGRGAEELPGFTCAGGVNPFDRAGARRDKGHEGSPGTPAPSGTAVVLTGKLLPSAQASVLCKGMNAEMYTPLACKPLFIFFSSGVFCSVEAVRASQVQTRRFSILPALLP